MLDDFLLSLLLSWRLAVCLDTVKREGEFDLFQVVILEQNFVRETADIGCRDLLKSGPETQSAETSFDHDLTPDYDHLKHDGLFSENFNLLTDLAAARRVSDSLPSARP